MNKLHQLKHLLLAGLLCATLAIGAIPPQASAESPNIITNNGFEDGTVTAPTGWFPDSWGTNDAVMTYVADAHTGNKAVATTMTSYQDGDGKWLFNAVPVSVGSSYTYTDYYKADAGTNLWAQFLMSDGTYQYKLIKIAPAAANWTQVTTSVTVPAGVSKLSIFHVLSSVGQLTVDDVSLSKDAPVSPPAECTPSYVNGLANGGFEGICVSSTGLPGGWTATQYGASSSVYVNTADAYHGAHAVAIANNTDGAETGLTTAIQSPLGGQRYGFNFAQAGDTYVYAYLAMGLSDGSTVYQSLMSVPATLGAWSTYTDVFVTPANIQSLQITIATSGIGTFTLDDVALTPLTNQLPSNFSTGVVSLTFDDGDASSYTNGFANLKRYGYKGTFYLNAGSLNTTGYMTTKQVKALAANGQEIGSHLYHHSDMVQLDTPTLKSELGGNINGLQQILGTSYQVNSFASPYGSYTSGTIDTVMQFEQSHRNTDGLLNTKANLNPRQIHAKLVTPNMTVAQLTALVTQAKNNHEWLVLVYHNISATTTGETEGEAGFTVTPTNFKKQLAVINQSGISVLPVNTALATLQAQL